MNELIIELNKSKHLYEVNTNVTETNLNSLKCYPGSEDQSNIFSSKYRSLVGRYNRTCNRYLKNKDDEEIVAEVIERIDYLSKKMCLLTLEISKYKREVTTREVAKEFKNTMLMYFKIGVSFAIAISVLIWALRYFTGLH